MTQDTQGEERRCDARMAEILRLSGRLQRLAVEADENCDKDSCLVVFGVVRDCAFKLRVAADGRLACLHNDCLTAGCGA